jgi:hypothetical protein
MRMMIRYLTADQTIIAQRLFRRGMDTLMIAARFRREGSNVTEAMVYNSLHGARENREAA